MKFRNYLTGIIFFVLLIWGPIDHSWPAWLLIRIGYVVLIPLTVWVLLGWAWNQWQQNDKLEITLVRIFSGIIFIALLVLAVREAISKTHLGNTQSIQTRHGIEDVGDDIILKGPNWGNIILLLIFAMLVLWFGVLKKGSKSSDS